jgi:hypothetical protein
MKPLERFWRWLAWILPRDLAMWCALRLMAHATTGVWGNETPSSVNMMEMLRRWEISSSLQINSGDPFVE